MIKKNWHLWGFAAIAILSLALRYEFWEVFSHSSYHAWSAHVLNYASNWMDEGYFYLKGILYNQPASVEFLDPASRIAFYNAFSFFVLPIYWIAKLKGDAPSLWTLNAFLFLLHVFFALGAAQLTYLFMKDFKEKNRRIGFLCAAIFVFFAYKLFYSYSISYWSELLVMPLVVYILYFEQFIQNKEKITKWVTLQQLFVLAACLADPYGFVFVLSLMAYHAYQKNWVRLLQLITPVAVAAALVLIFVLNIATWAHIKAPILAELGMFFSPNASVGTQLSGVFIKHLGLYALAFLASFGVAEYLQRKDLLSSKNVFVLFAPPVIYGLLFASKSMGSELSALKFYLPCAVLFFGILPAMAYTYADALSKKKKEEKLLFKFFSFSLPLFVVGVFIFNYQDFRALFKEDPITKELKWIRSISQPEQVIFSNSFSLNFSPPQSVYLLRKPIWKFDNIQVMKTWSGIFRDVVDYPLLWLDKNSKNANHCERLYLQNGATRVSSYVQTTAYLFSSVKNFMAMPAPDLEKCMMN